MSVAFPTERDLTQLSREDAQRALRALRKFDLAGVAEVYDFRRPDRSHEWVVWLPITRRRMTLQKWAAQWLAEQDTTPPDAPFGGDAA